MSRTRWTAALVALVVLAAVVAALWWRFGHAVAVGMVTVAEGPVAVRVVGPGTVQARVPITLASRVTATVSTVRADVGDAVRAGQLLVTLDDRDLSARRDAVASQRVTQQRNVEAAEAALQRSRAELALALSRQQRDAELQARGFVSDAGLDGSRAALEAARAAEQSAVATLEARRSELATSAHELTAAETGRSYAQLSAPRDAVVIQRLAEPGTTVVPGTPLLKLVDPSSIWVAMRVDETMLERLRPGLPATILLRSGATHAGQVARIARQSDPATREIDVHIAFDRVPADFAIDQQAEITVQAGEQRGLRVPVSALVRDSEGRAGLLAVSGDRTRFVPARLGATDGQHVLVQGELAAGDRVVAPAEGVRAGMRVKPASGR
jgi:RND family efflux transporter MFP subunit